MERYQTDKVHFEKKQSEKFCLLSVSSFQISVL